ncbi:hypothetical protein KAR91_57280 [Candidatus Pacearchaeota archaeon]|nr:hypothetical protein [Candidatus Pacearchaeota archaeon]
MKCKICQRYIDPNMETVEDGMCSECHLIRDLDGSLGMIHAAKKILNAETANLAQLKVDCWRIGSAQTNATEGAAEIQKVLDELQDRRDIRYEECPENCTMRDDGCWKDCEMYQDALIELKRES